MFGLIWHKIGFEAEAFTQSSDLRSSGRMRAQLLIGSLAVASAVMAAEAVGLLPTLWVSRVHDYELSSFH